MHTSSINTSINMKIASFFVALLVGGWTHAPSAAAENGRYTGNWTVYAGPAQHRSCAPYGSTYTSKSGKGMSMSKSGKGLRTSKSSKANSGGMGVLNVSFIESETGAEFWIRVEGVHPDHCVGELKQLVINELVEAGVHVDGYLNVRVGSDALLETHQSFYDQGYFKTYAEVHSVALVPSVRENQITEGEGDEPVRRD